MTLLYATLGRVRNPAVHAMLYEIFSFSSYDWDRSLFQWMQAGLLILEYNVVLQ